MLELARATETRTSSALIQTVYKYRTVILKLPTQVSQVSRASHVQP